MINLSRRGFLAGVASSLAAPAIVRASSMMPLRGSKLILPFRSFKPVWYVNLIRDKNVLLEPTDYDGPPYCEFRGVKIRVIEDDFTIQAAP